MLIQIDEYAGVCPGVARAIVLAEKALGQGNTLTAVGPIIHNRIEIERLEDMGLKTFDQSIFENTTGWKEKLKGHKLLIRAHGISPVLREKLLAANFSLVDATCPTVIRSQKLVAEYSRRGYQIVIAGKPKHPEVLGLMGCANDSVSVVMKPEDLDSITTSQKAFLIAQTTIDINLFHKLEKLIKARIPELAVKNTICGAMQARYKRIKEFARANDLIIFVGGHNSSNTGVLCDICRNENTNSFHIEDVNEIDRRWFNGFDRIGIAGSASTPRWQLENVQTYLRHLIV